MNFNEICKTVIYDSIKYTFENYTFEKTTGKDVKLIHQTFMLISC